MLLDSCSIEMHIGFALENNSNQGNRTAFPKVVSDFFEEDIYVHREDTTPLAEKKLLLEHVDFQIISMAYHTNRESQAQKNTDKANMEQVPTQCITTAM